LPAELKGLFSAESDEARIAKLTIPLNEVFQNLPGVEPPPPRAKLSDEEPEPDEHGEIFVATDAAVLAEIVGSESAENPFPAPSLLTPPAADLEELIQQSQPSAVQVHAEAPAQFGNNGFVNGSANDAPATETDRFITDGRFDSGKAVGHVASLPGVRGAVVTVENDTKTAGQIPEGINVTELGKAADILFLSLGSQPESAKARDITLHHGEFSTTYFKQGGVLLGVVHPQRALDAGTHELAARAAEEIARLRQG
jgi:hypothetical protein